MAVGCLIYTNAEGEVIHRLPFWPWPKPGIYPQQSPDGTWVQFFICRYTNFALGDKISPFPPAPYISRKENL